MSNKQDQSVSEGSTAVQAAGDINVYSGLSYLEVRQAALDVFRSNFYELAGIAKQVAEDRAKVITESFLVKLQEEHSAGFGQANDPGFQYALYTAQKEYARTGDADLAGLLVDLLVDRTKQPQRDILQIVLDESLNTAPKLTEDQLATLAVLFFLKYAVANQAVNHYALGDAFDRFLQPFVSKFSTKAASFQHLEFTGCGSNPPLMHRTIGHVFLNSYQGLFVNGFVREDLDEDHRSVVDNYPSFFCACLNDGKKLQVSALNKVVLEKLLAIAAVPDTDKGRINKLFDLNVMNDDQIREKCVAIRGYMADIFEVWNTSGLKNFRLTSVGIAIGHANIKRLSGEFADLSVWIH
jgi:hypothetical protein